MDQRLESFLLNTDNFLVFFIVFGWGKNKKLTTKIFDLQK